MAKVSTKGYKKNSKDKNEPFLRIPSSTITMKEDDGTPLRKGPILGIDNFGNQQLMLPGMDYQFPGNSVYEIPMAKMGGAKKVKIHSLPKAQNGLATAADSSLVANRANDVFNYYKNNPAYDVTRPVYPPGVTPPPPPSPSDLAKLLKRSREAYNEAVSESNGRTLLHVDRSGKTKVANNPKLEDYYQDLGNNKFLQRELSFGAINIDSPMPIYDTRINPQKLSAFDMRPNFVTNQQVRAGAGYPFNTMPIRDHVEVATYDVLATTPWAELSTEEQLKRLKKFGTSGSPYKNKAAAIKKLKAQLNAPKVEPPIIDKPVQIPNQPEDFKIPFKADPNRKQFLIKSTGDAALDKLNQELYGNFGSLTNNGYIPEYSPYIKDVETRTPEKEMRRIKTPKFNYGGDLPKAQPGLEVPLDADRYGVNKFIPKGDDTQYVDPALFQQVQDLQNRINPLAQSSKAARQEYEKKVLDAINKVESQNYDVTTSGYIPESVRQSEDVKQNGLNGCISGVCYTLNEAGEPVKYYSNSMFQDAIKAGTEKDWALDFDTKNISGGDIIQFTGDREGPHHAALVVPNSIVNNEDGTITFEAFMNSGDGPMYKKTYTLDPKEDRVDNFRNETVQLLKRKNTSDLDNLVNQRDQLKAQIEAADPAAFKKGRARRWNTYMPGAFRELGVDYTRFDGQDPERMVAGSMMQNLNLEDAARLLRQTTISTPKPIDGIKIKFDSKYDVDYDALRKTAGFENILNQVNDPEFKMNFMKDMNITNREYNAIVSNTFGIYGQETGFGTKANSIKETDVARKTDSVLGDVWSRVTGHGAFKRDIDEDYSRGLTQVKLKNIKGQDRRQYGINKESIESDPTKAFTAAMIANAQNLPELRKLASKGETDALGMNNYLDFIPYMYNQPNRIRRGDRKTIEEALAEGQDPAQALVIDPNSPMANNEYIKNVRTYANLFKFMPLAADAPDEKASQIPTKAYGGDISVPDLRRVKIDSLPKAQTGIPADYQKFLQYSETAPDNRRPDAEWQYGNPRQYDHYGMWDALGKPENFDQALEMNPHWQPDPYDGMYHGFSTNPSTGVWLKSHIPGESHPGDTGWMEYKDFMLSNDRNWGGKNQNLVYDPELQRMRYIERNKKGGSLPKAQKGKEWLDLGYENKVYTYKDNPDFFDSHARLSDNPRYNDWIKQTVYSGKWGYNPVTGESVRLDANQQATVDPITQNLAKDKRTFNEIRKTDKAFDEHLKQAEKESGKAVGRAQSKAMVSNPAFYAPGVIGAAAVAPEVLPPLFESIGGALATPLMHPITGATIMPGLTGGAVIDAAFAAHGLKTIVSGEAIEPWRHAAQTGNVSDYLSAAGQNFITALETLPVTGPLVKGGLELSKPALDATGKFLTTQTPLKNTYKINPWAGKLGEYNRVVGSDAIADLQASGLVRSGKGAVTTEGGIPVSRPTAWPSFAKGSPRETYMRGVTERGDTPYIISTDRPMAVSTLGRHGKGSTQFPVGPDGNYLTSFPASEATVYKGSPNWLRGYEKVNTPKKLEISMPEMPVIGAPTQSGLWTLENLPGLHLESTVTGGPISKIIEPKTGLINTEQALKIIGKEAGGKEKLELVRNAIGENIPAKMDYNQFRKLVQDAIIPLERRTVNYNSNYGLGHIGFPSPKRSNIELALNNSEQEVARLTGELDKLTTQISDIKAFRESVAADPSKAFLANGTDEQIKTYLEGIEKYTKEQLASSAKQVEDNRKMLSQAPLTNETLLLSNKEQLGRGAPVHGNPDETLGHIHYYVDAENPSTAVMTQMQSDAFQGTHRVMPSTLQDATNKMIAAQEDLDWTKALYTGTDNGSLAVIKKANEQFAFDNATVKNYVQKSLLDKKHQERYLQEFVQHSAEKGMTKVRIPTSETAAKIQGYNPMEFDTSTAAAKEARRRVMDAHRAYGPESQEFKDANDAYDALVKSAKPEYIPEQKTILKKYDQMPKTVKKTFGEEVQIVTDGKGNTWYEFSIPENFIQGKGEIKAFKKGGSLPKAQPGLEVNQQNMFIPLDADRYGINKFIPKGDDTQYIDPALFQQVQDLQNRINPLAQNSRAARQEYEKKVLDAINRVEPQNYDVTTSGYIPESVRQSEDVKQNGLNGCISGVCYTLNEAGEPVRYYSNSMFQDAIKSGTEKNWALDFDTKNISGGDIVQFTGDREGPHHAALVVPNSIVNNEDGTITFEAFMNSGDGPMYRKTYTLDPKEDRVDNFRNETIQLLKRKNVSDLDNLVSQRDKLKAQIEAADPGAFKKGRARRWNTYMPGAFRELGVDYINFEGRDPDALVAGSMMQNLNLDDAGKLLTKNTINNDIDYTVLRKSAGFENILNQVNDPEFKMKFMKDMNITNREYNAIVSNTFGIYGQETGFGTKADSIKETDAARKADSVLGDIWSRVTGHGEFKSDIGEDYSRGLTQVKLRNIKAQDRRQYGINKESIESDPTKAFIAAMIANSQNLPELRKLASKGETDALGMNNYLDFIPYMYNQPNRIRRGDRKTIEEALAEGQDPAQALVVDPNSPMANNEYIKNVRTYADLFKFMPLAADAPDEKASQIPTKAYGGDISVPNLRRVKINTLPNNWKTK